MPEGWSGELQGNRVNQDSNIAGFTLLELVVVSALIGILLVVSVPAMRSNLLDDPLRKSSRKMIGYLLNIREQALREQQPYLVYFDLDESRVWHLKADDAGEEKPEAPEKGVLEMDAGVSIRDVWTRSGDTVGRGITELWVSRQGYLDRTVVHLEGGGSDGVSLVLSPFLFAIEVEDGYYEPE